MCVHACVGGLTSGKHAAVRLMNTTVEDSGRHGVFADSRAVVHLEAGTVVQGSLGCGACASGRGALLIVVPPPPATVPLQVPQQGRLSVGPGTGAVATAVPPPPTSPGLPVLVSGNRGGDFWESHGGVIRGVERSRVDGVKGIQATAASSSPLPGDPSDRLTDREPKGRQ